MWIADNAGFTQNPCVVSLAVLPNGSSPSTIFAGTATRGARMNGVYMSAGGGSGWTATGAGIPDTRISMLFINGGYLYAGTDGFGVWKAKIK